MRQGLSCGSSIQKTYRGQARVTSWGTHARVSQLQRERPLIGRHRVSYVTNIKRKHGRFARHVRNRSSFPPTMGERVEHSHTMRRFTTGKTIQGIKSYFKSWSYGTSTTTGVVKVQSGASITAQETKHARSSGPAEAIHLFPGWAIRRYVDNDKNKFDIHVHISGYVTRRRFIGQRAFLRLLKVYAGLNELAQAYSLRSSPTDPPDSDELKGDEPLQELNEAYKLALGNLDGASSEPPFADDEYLHPSSNEPLASDVLRRLEQNLEKRIQIVLGNNMLSSCAVDLELFVSSHHDTAGNSFASTKTREGLHSVLQSSTLTGPDGSFQHDFVIRWDDICHYPIVQYSYGQRIKEHELVLHAGLSSPSYLDGERSQTVKLEVQVIPITHAPIRVISDIDDTIKFSDILGGKRAVFRNVFVHDLEDTTIPGMSDWYTRMWDEGVRFHYVSNSPLQMLPLIKAFLHVSKLPSGSIKLKSYVLRSIFNQLLTPPADRKREGLNQVLKSFPDSKFILIGDSGEQDLELYAQIAKLHPSQILAIFIRDVEPDTDPIADATGKEWKKHVVSRSNSEAYSSSLVSRSNSVLSVLRPVRQKSRTSSVHGLPSPPSSRSASMDDASQFQDFPPTCSEPNQITGDSYFNMNVSSSPPSVSPLSEADGESDSIHMRMKQNRTREEKAENSPYKAAQEAYKRKFAFMSLDEEPVISQSPEAVSVLKANMDPAVHGSPKLSNQGLLTRTSSTSRGTAQNRPSSRHRLQSNDNAVTSRPFPRLTGRNTISHPSDSNSPLTSPSTLSLISRYPRMSESEKKRAALQKRVWRAKAETPEHIPLRIFRHPTDCIEVDDLLKSGML